MTSSFDGKVALVTGASSGMGRATKAFAEAGAAVVLADRNEETAMPHVIVKLWAGKSERQKARIAEEVTKAIMTSTGYGEESVSVSIEDVEPSEWTEKVYKPDILGRQEQLYKEPGSRQPWPTPSPR